MKAMVFAAGEGQRLRPITEKLPKPLVQVAGRPMIEYPLLLLRHYGIRDIIINLHHLGDLVETHLGDGTNLGLQIRYSKENELLDTGGGLLKARPFLQDDTFIVINTDVLIDLPLAEFIAFHKLKKAIATLALRPDPLADQYGSLEVRSDGRIDRFLQTWRPRAPRARRGMKLMFTGLQILEPRVFDYMGSADAVRKFSTTKDTYPALLQADEALYGYRYDGFWRDLGTLERIREAEASLAAEDVRLHYL